MSRSNAAESGGPSLTLVQQLDARDFLPLALRHGALNIATLGLYRFWGRSESRRRLWAATDMNGEPLDYGGLGVELMIGALAKLVVVGAALAAAVAAVRGYGAWGAPAALVAAASVTLFLGFCRFVGFVYLATRTEWRGQVFEVDGSSATFALGELRDAAISVLTLGWSRPAADRRRDAALWGGLRHPHRPAAYDAAAAARRPLYSVFAIGWFGTVMIALFAAGVLLGLAAGLVPTIAIGTGSSLGLLAGLVALVLGLWPPLVLAWAPYQAARRSATAAGLGLALPLRRRAWARLQATNTALRIVSLGALAPYAAARESAFVFSRLEEARRLSRRTRAARRLAAVAFAPVEARAGA
ncbi:MAG: hypothetical protein C0481_18045 [Phenylobacterium sp.]|uniref:DUF898 family protein n=1 Tax=Phenylobacterium sp. TaxID=1871053 RepID=UPI0025CD1362|nr:DUF898 family protein [Phenylobacterium sp.]MBA4013767.1 hypothetical protein [Phenylobacterium sp.]